MKYKTFGEKLAANPDSSDDQDCRPGPPSLDPDYSDSLIPEHMRARVMEVRRQRGAEAARELERDDDKDRFEQRPGKIAKETPAEKARPRCVVPG